MRLFSRIRPLGLVCLACLTLLPIAGCEQMGIEVPNPFATSTDINQIYYSQFPNIPIPVDMLSNRSGTVVVAAADGGKTGRESFQGRVDKASLTSAMLHNMASQGWNLLGTVAGSRTLQLFEKDQRYAVLFIHEQPLGSIMEVWVPSKLADGGSFNLSAPISPMQPASSPMPGTASPFSPSSSASPAPASTATEQWEGGPGGLSSQKLGQ